MPPWVAASSPCFGLSPLRSSPLARPEVWAQAFEAAHAFWTRAATDRRLSRGMREISAGNARQIAEVVAPLLPAGAQR